MSAGITEHDGPAYAEFDVRRGDTTSIGVVLQTQDVFTQEITALSFAGKVLHWFLQLPSGTIDATSETGGGLAVDAGSGAVIYPMSAAFTAALPQAPVRTVLRLVDTGTSEITTWLDGYVVPKG